MTNDSKKYVAKILLFGEHTVLKGSEALAIPFPTFSGKWVYAKNPEIARLRQMDLPLLLDYLEKKKEEIEGFLPNTDALRKDLDDGVFFQSNIPLGYGAGSSGALCAAIYDQYFYPKTKDPIQLKKIFALLESFFHGSSSGFDPLICYLRQPIHIKEGVSKILNPFEGAEGLFLIDTGISRSAESFINIFLEKCKDEAFETVCEKEINPMVSHAIESYLKGEAVSLFHQMHDVSLMQYLHLQELIPEDFRLLWEKGLKSPFFKMKLCGAGGGGFLLGITKDFDKTKKVFGNIELLKI